MTRRMAFATTAVSAIALTACGHAGSSGATQRSVDGLRVLPPTAQQIGFAQAIAQQEVQRQGQRITAGGFFVAPGTEDNPNVGPRCTSGTVLRILLVGEFPHVATSGMPNLPGQPPRDYTVRALTITADGATGKACLEGAVTGHPKIDPASTVLSVK